MVAQRYYSRYGLVIASDIVAFGMAVKEPRGVSADLEVSYDDRGWVPTWRLPEGEVLALRLGPDGQPFSTLVRSTRGYLLRLSTVADFSIDETCSRIVCRPDPRCPAGLVQVLLQSVVLAFVLSLRGRFVLHSSAVVVDSQVLAVAGPPWSGKTTLAALLCAGGAALFADDFVCVESGPKAVGTGPGPELRLRPAARGVLGLFPTLPASYETCDGRIAFSPPRCAYGTAALGGVVLPEPAGKDEGLWAERLHGSLAVRGLASAARIAGWVDRVQQQRFFESVVALARDVPVWRIKVPWGPPFSAIQPSTLLGTLTAASPKAGATARASTV